MGNFGSKEDILSEIEGLFKKINSGKLTLDELEDLVSLSRELHERTVILRYKAFEEKVFGERPVAVTVPQVNAVFETEVNEIIEEPVPVIEAAQEEEEEIIDENPAFEIDIKEKEEPAFGFSLFGNDEEEEEKEEVSHETPSEPVTQHFSHEDKQDDFENDGDEEVSMHIIDEEIDIPEEINTPDSLEIEEVEDETPAFESTLEIDEEVKPEAPRPMSELERAHAENLARFFNKSQSQETSNYEAPVETVPAPVTQQEDAPVYETAAENPVEEEEEIQTEPAANFYHEEEHSEEVEETPEFTNHFSHEETNVEEPEVESPVNTNLASSIFVHKFNQVNSELVSSQFGLVKLDSLLGSFGLNERLQFINELFDGSSEGFSNAIKALDQQASSDHARSKVAEFAIENNWDVESDTVTEFMQKIVRRYA